MNAGIPIRKALDAASNALSEAWDARRDDDAQMDRLASAAIAAFLRALNITTIGFATSEKSTTVWGGKDVGEQLASAAETAAGEQTP